jgi:manganese transport protein
MGEHRIGPVTEAASWVVALVIAGLNLALGWQAIGGWLQHAVGGAWLLRLAVMTLVAALLALLGYVVVQPLLARRRGTPTAPPADLHGPAVTPALAPATAPRRVAVAVDFSAADQAALSHAVGLLRGPGGEPRGELVLLHVVESGGAQLLGDELRDRETLGDEERLARYAEELRRLGLAVSTELGFGDPAAALSALVNAHAPDLVVLGSHGHGALGDLLLGTSIERLRHRIKVPVMVVPAGG